MQTSVRLNATVGLNLMSPKTLRQTDSKRRQAVKNPAVVHLRHGAGNHRSAHSGDGAAISRAASPANRVPNLADGPFPCLAVALNTKPRPFLHRHHLLADGKFRPIESTSPAHTGAPQRPSSHLPAPPHNDNAIRNKGSYSSACLTCLAARLQPS